MFKKFREVLNAFGIFDDEIDTELNKVFFERNGKVNDKPKQDQSASPSAQTFRCVEIDPPPGMYLVDQAPPDDVWAEVAREYLAWRNTPTAGFMLSTDPTYRERLIIPSYRFGRLVFWQSRAFDDKVNPRYINCETPKENALYGYDNLTAFSKLPLFVTEGTFDAGHVNGVSIFGSSLSEYQLQELKNVKNRQVVFVIDKDRNGKSLGAKVIREGWPITFLSGEIDDIDDSIRKMGKLWTISNLMQNIKEGLEASVWLEMIQCPDDLNTNNKKKGNDHVSKNDTDRFSCLGAMLGYGTR
jgi:hypothetical protein